MEKVVLAKLEELPELQKFDGDKLEESIQGTKFPVGAADTEAFVDFSLYALATESVYSMPGAPVGKVPAVQAGVVTTMLNYLLAKNPAAVAVANYLGGAVQGLPDVAAIVAYKLGLNAYAAVNPEDQNEVDLDKIRELAKQLDGLIPIQGYDFAFFQPDTVNLGLMLIYRQKWKP